jgi:hypothetical protein
MKNGIYPENYRTALSREDLYFIQEREKLNLVVLVFITIMVITRIDRMYTNIANPFGLPGGLSQVIFYVFGFAFLFAIKEKKELPLPWKKVAMVLWVVGLLLAVTMAIRPREALTQSIAFALYFVSGYGVYKACLDDKIFRHFAKLTILVGIGWSLVITYVFFENGGKLPYEYIAFMGEKGTFNHHSYGVLIINGGVCLLALISKKQGTVWNILIPMIISGTFFAIIISQARANFLAFATTASYILLQNENIRGKGAFLIKSVWLILSVIVVVWALKEGSEKYEDVYKRFDFQDEQYQMQKSHGRPEMIKKALILISTHPFGVGGGNTRFTSVERADLMRIEGYLLHNQYLSSIAEGGWIMILVWIFILKETLVKPFKYVWKRPERLAVYCCWFNYCIDGLFADMLGDYFFLLLFLVSAAVALEAKDRSH